jgi:hypothetical protein
VTSIAAIDPSVDPTEVAALARRLLQLVDRAELVADDARGRRMVALWAALAGEGASGRPHG